VWHPDQFEWIPGAIDAIRRLNEAGYLVVIVTNQSGVARGLYTEEDVEVLSRWADRELALHGARIDAWYHCPHHPDFGEPPYRLDCDCRKPKGGMILRALRELPIDPDASFLVGDKQRDIDAGHAAGVKGYMFDGKNLDETVRGILMAHASRPA
jgi:D-glycero-D-manno-heptose 1,7-bisphosphate phosphatase